MNAKELRALPDDELVKKSNEARFELMKLNAQVSTGTTPKNPGQIRLLRRTLARIEHFLSERAKQSAATVGATKRAPSAKKSTTSTKSTSKNTVTRAGASDRAKTGGLSERHG